MDGAFSSYVQLPVSLTVVQGEDGWSAFLSSQSKLSIQQTVKSMVSAVLERDQTYQRDVRRLRVSAALPGLLTDAFGGASYAELLTMTDFAQSADGNDIVTFSFPDPAFVYSALAELYAASYNQQFTGMRFT